MATTTVRRGDDGTDRIFVRGVDGRRLGWHDLGSGATHLVDSDAGRVVGAAVDRYVASRSPLRRRGAGVLAGPRSAGLLSTAPRSLREPDGAGPVAQEDLRERRAGEASARALLHALPAALPAQGLWARLVGRDPLAPVNRAHHHQVLAERQVGQLLAGLGRWRSLHCLPVAAGQSAHHLLIGAGGVVLVRTCAHRGEVVSVVGETVLAASGPSEALQVVRAQAAAVAGSLGRARGGQVPVHALVVVAGARRLHVEGAPRGSTVLREVDLLRWLQDRPAVLSSVEVERLVDEAARPGTWPGHPDPSEPVVAGGGGGSGDTDGSDGSGGSGRTGDALARERRGRRRHDRLRLDEWTAAVGAAARRRAAVRLSVLVGAGAVVPVLLAALAGT